MKKFKDLGIKNESTDFTEEKISIMNLVNRPIIVHGFKADVHTENGTKHLMRIGIDGQFKVVFTGSSRIIAALNHPEISFPFETVIQMITIGQKRAYMFS